MDIVFRLPHLFSPVSNEREDAAVLCELVESLARIDELFLEMHPDTPTLYTSGVFYDRTKEWLPIPACKANRGADCKSLTAWRLAELRRKGIRCKGSHRWMPRANGGGKDFHILVRIDGGGFEDPSKVLGMGTNENAWFSGGRGLAVSRTPNLTYVRPELRPAALGGKGDVEPRIGPAPSSARPLISTGAAALIGFGIGGPVGAAIGAGLGWFAGRQAA